MFTVKLEHSCVNIQNCFKLKILCTPVAKAFSEFDMMRKTTKSLLYVGGDESNG